MRISDLLVCGLVSGLLMTGMVVRAEAATIAVDLSTQTMHVSSGEGSYDWPISSARAGYVTPRGTYGVQSLQAMHLSHKYHNSPMPHSIFFRGGYAIHGTYDTAALGEPASHGCVRLAPGNAAVLFGIVKAEGASITITGSPAGSSRYASVERRHRHAERYASAERHHHHADRYASAERHHRRAERYAMRHVRASSALGYAEDVPHPVPTFEDWLRAPAGE